MAGLRDSSSPPDAPANGVSAEARAVVREGAAGTAGRSRAARLFYMGAGSTCVGIGTVGMFVPLVPTTIFLILAAACYGRSSDRAYRWLTTNRLFGSYLRNYQERRGATVRHKVISIISLWVGIGTTIVFVPTPLLVNVLLLGIAIGVTWHLVSIATIRD